MEIERLIDFSYYRKVMVSTYLHKVQSSLDLKIVPGVLAYKNLFRLSSLVILNTKSILPPLSWRRDPNGGFFVTYK